MRKLPEFSLGLGKIWFWDPAYVLSRGIEEVNPLSPKSDQHQISPCNINAL